MRYALGEGGEVVRGSKSLAFEIMKPGFIFFFGGGREFMAHESIKKKISGNFQQRPLLAIRSGKFGLID